jgi:hypothetical protein
MKTEIKYLWGKDDLLIDLGKRTEPRIRIIYCIEFLVTIGIATVLLLQSFRLQFNWLQFITSTCIGIVYLLAAYRFLSRMFYREKLFITSETFSIIRKTIFRRTIATYEWEGMGPLHYAVKEAKTDHPLKGKSFDYFGFDTQEHVVQYLHHEGNLYFNYNEIPVRFARGIYSWHAEEIVNMIRLFSGPALQLGPEWKNMMQEIDWTEGM